MARAAIHTAILSVLVATSTQCDPKTHYMDGGVCCKKCEPGTKMALSGTCQNPVCNQCGDDEYQDSYTTDTKCKLQPSCDSSKNFLTLKNKTSLITCQCRTGFQCSSPLCITCMPRPPCPPGHQATNIRDQHQETVCEKCPNNTFSSERSWNNTCVSWTECDQGEETPGTDTTDRTCQTLRYHGVVSAVVVILLVAVLGIGAALVLLRKNQKCRKCLQTGDHGYTARGNVVSQENGKEERRSVQESLVP